VVQPLAAPAAAAGLACQGSDESLGHTADARDVERPFDGVAETSVRGAVAPNPPKRAREVRRIGRQLESGDEGLPPGPSILQVPARPAMMGQASGAYPYVIQAVKSMCERGLGRERTPFVLERVSDGQATVYDASESVLRPPSTQWWSHAPGTARCRATAAPIPSPERRQPDMGRSPCCLSQQQ